MSEKRGALAVARERNKRMEYLRIASNNLLYLSSTCASRIGERADLYECGNVMALVGNPLGEYHLGRKSDKCQGRNLCSAELVRYLREKYSMEVGESLSAWCPQNELGPVAYFADRVTEQESGRTIESGFYLVELGYRKRYGEWVFVEDNCISFTAGIRESLPQQMELYEGDGLLALRGKMDGAYTPEDRGRRKSSAIYSSVLTEYCRKWAARDGRSILFHAQEIKDGVAFSLNEEKLPRRGEKVTLKQVKLGEARDKFLCFISGGIYISAKASRMLEGRFSLYSAGEWLAMKRDEQGEFPIRQSGYQNLVCCKELVNQIRSRYPEKKKILLLERDGFLIMSHGDKGKKHCPRGEDFSAMDIIKKRKTKITPRPSLPPSPQERQYR